MWYYVVRKKCTPLTRKPDRIFDCMLWAFINNFRIATWWIAHVTKSLLVFFLETVLWVYFHIVDRHKVRAATWFVPTNHTSINMNSRLENEKQIWHLCELRTFVGAKRLLIEHSNRWVPGLKWTSLMCVSITVWSRLTPVGWLKNSTCESVLQQTESVMSQNSPTG